MSHWRQGDIHYGNFPEPIKSRPIIILSTETLNSVREKVVVALITTRVRGNIFEIPVGIDEGLPKESVISLSDIHTVDKAFLSSQKGNLSDDKLRKLKDSLKLLFAII